MSSSWPSTNTLAQQLTENVRNAVLVVPCVPFLASVSIVLPHLHSICSKRGCMMAMVMVMVIVCFYLLSKNVQ